MPTPNPDFQVDVQFDGECIDFRNTSLQEKDENSAIPESTIKYGDKFASTENLPSWITSMRIFIDLTRDKGEQFRISRQFVILNPEANKTKFKKKKVVKKENKVVKPTFELGEDEGL